MTVEASPRRRRHSYGMAAVGWSRRWHSLVFCQPAWMQRLAGICQVRAALRMPAMRAVCGGSDINDQAPVDLAH